MIAIGSKVLIINDYNYFANYGPAFIPKELIVHGNIHGKPDIEGEIITTYKEYYLVKFIGKRGEMTLGFKEDNLQAIEIPELSYSIYH